MSFIAGAVALQDSGLAPTWRQALSDALPPHGGLVLSRHDDAAASILQVDLGCFGTTGLHREPLGAVAVAGEPFLDLREHDGRARGAASLLHASLDVSCAMVARSAGNWAGAVWREDLRQLRLFADRLSSRPLYWWSDATTAVFASTISVFERLEALPRRVDYQGLLEQVGLGYALADRTPYLAVRRLLAGELVVLSPGATSRRRYWSWSSLPETPDGATLSARTLESMRVAIARRLGGRTRATTFLSGGMDSRVINQLLLDEGVRVRSFNFSPVGSQDAELGRAYAEAAGTDHRQVPRTVTTFTAWAALLAAAKRAFPDPAHPTDEPAWSGDGGSVCAGWVYVEPGIVDAMRRGDAREAVRTHLRSHGNPLGSAATRRRFRAWADGRLETAILSELDGYPASLDPARRFFLFLVENDQRRHLDGHFEQILEHRQELWTPFLDGDFLAVALSAPVDAGVGHGVYDQWFRMLSPAALSVPWQTYPGHVPCPLPVPESLGYQWSARVQRRPSTMGELLGWLRLLVSPRFPDAVLRRSVALANLALQALRLRERRGWLDQVAQLQAYWNRADHVDRPY